MEIEVFGRKFRVLVDAAQYIKLHNMLVLYFNKQTIIIIFASIIICLLWLLKARRFGTNSKIYKWLALISYVIILLSLTVLNRKSGSCRELRLVYDPWFSGDGAYHESTIIIAICDCMLFIPFGMLYRWAEGRTDRYTSLLTVIVVASFMIEFFQFILARGVSSIEDFTAFIVGGFIGIIFADSIVRY